MIPCPHCGAVPSGEMLMGFHVVVHAKDCPLLPKLDHKALKETFKAVSLSSPRWICGMCGCTGDTEKGLQHSQDCPANPLTN